jgi:hypothetical protein
VQIRFEPVWIQRESEIPLRVSNPHLHRRLGRNPEAQKPPEYHPWWRGHTSQPPPSHVSLSQQNHSCNESLHTSAHFLSLVPGQELTCSQEAVSLGVHDSCLWAIKKRGGWAKTSRFKANYIEAKHST